MKKGPNHIFLCFVVVFAIFHIDQEVFSASFMEKFIDPEDGMPDCSDWLLKHEGFLPVPQIITKPAIGYGAG